MGQSGLYQNSGLASSAVGASAGLNNSGDWFVGVGAAAGYGNSGTNHIYIGTVQTGFTGNSGNYVLCLGTDVAQGNTISNAFIIDNNHLPSYASHAAAVTGFTGGIAGNTYLYYNSSNNAIEAVRF